MELAEAMDSAILAAARRHFLETGYARTSMDAIAATAQVGKPTLYTRYATKEALHQAVVVTAVQALAARNEKQVNLTKPRDLKRRLQRRAREIMLALISDELRVIMRLAADSPTEDVCRALFRQESEAIKQIERDIVEGTKGFRTPPENPALAAEMLMALLFGWRTAQRERDQIPIEEALDYADHAVELFFAGRATW